MIKVIRWEHPPHRVEGRYRIFYRVHGYDSIRADNIKFDTIKGNKSSRTTYTEYKRYSGGKLNNKSVTVEKSTYDN